MSDKTTRRHFIGTIGKAMGVAAAAPVVIPASALGKGGATAPSERIGMGFIGLGTMGSGHLFGEAWTYLPEGYAARDDVQVLALCDVWKEKREKIVARLHYNYSAKYGRGNYQACETYADFRELLARDDIDAVMITTPIHWHSAMTVLAAEAGKDVYCEKPTAVTIHDSKAMVNAIKKNGRVFQAGTQQRSEYEAKFRITCEMVRNKRIGDLQTVYAFCDGGGAMWHDPSGDEVPVPEGFDWDLWLGPAPEMPFRGRADAHLFGYGGINWGQHHYDIVQWCLDADRTGPVEISYDEGCAKFRYANGVEVHGRPYNDEKIGETGGGWYIGTEGKIAVDRKHLVSDPEAILERPIGEDDVHVYRSNSHSINFLECVKSRKQTICDIETAHRAASVLLLGGIASQLKRTLKWDPVKEEFINDDEANKLLSLPARDPWKI